MKLILVIVFTILALNPDNHGTTLGFGTKTSNKELLKHGKKNRENEYYKAYNQTLMHWDVPFHEMDIPTHFGSAHVITCGPENGDPLVLLHGMNASSTMWYPNVKTLSKKYRIYAIDYLKEPGKSKMTEDLRNFDDVVSWYKEIFENLSLDTFSIIGASKGGWLAIKIATALKSRVDKLVLLSPLQAFSKIQPDAEIKRMLTFPIVPTRKRWQRAMELMSVKTDKIEESFMEQIYLASKKAKPDKLLIQIIPFTADDLKSIAVPVLLLIGDKDIINNEKSLDKAKQLLPHCETTIIEKAGHFLSIDQSEVVNEKILNFLL